MNHLKKLIASIDRRYLGGILEKTQENQRLNDLQSGLEFKITTYYSKNVANEIAQLCDLYGSDKGEIKSEGHP